LVTTAILEKPAANNALPGRLSAALEELRAAMSGAFEPNASEIATKAATARQALQAAARIDSQGQVLDRQGRPLDVGAVLQADAPASRVASWDEPCQRVALLAASARSLKDADRLGAMRPGTRDHWRERMGQVSRLLRFTRADREWPAVLEFNAPTTMADVARELDSLRLELQSAANRTTITTWEATP
jgi:hypothetical protein